MTRFIWRRLAAVAVGGALLLATACGGNSSGPAVPTASSGSQGSGPSSVNTSGTPGVPAAAAGNTLGGNSGTGLQVATAVGPSSALGTATATR